MMDVVAYFSELGSGITDNMKQCNEKAQCALFSLCVNRYGEVGGDSYF